ncbi:MAG TPA: cupin domain-containing protein [Gemmatimonadaceae bacterium]|nr:cupin domain-containing protein [Gemmatimonadaceae bacterium]
MRILRITGVLLVALCAYTARAAAQSPDLKWGPAPAIFPAGARMAVLSGDPSKSELFTVRLDMPDGYTIAPHWHPTDEHVTVIRGTFLVGMGDKFDLGKTMALPAGGFVTAGARMNHFARAKGHTIVQVHAMGPFALTYVNPSDDPTKKLAKH